jgi:VWFA-related protein
MKRLGLLNLLLASMLCGFGVFERSVIAQTPEPSEVIRVDSDLVDLKVSVLRRDPLHAIGELRQSDFVILEDGKPQEIAFFAGENAPFDLVLLLDLSGSTSDKLDLVKKSAKRFVEATRPIDRVAIVTFTSRPLLVSPLTLDRKLLKASIKNIEKPGGGTNFWDALDFVLSSVLPEGNLARRSAVVAMTDGVDNALPGIFGEGSRTPFADLLDHARASDVIVLPVYLDTEKEEVQRHRSTASAYSLAREQLTQLAEIGGTRVYLAKKLKDLDRVYEQVINDLGTVYSLGYKPTNTSRDGKWRSVAVQLVGRSGLSARTKPGYFTKAQN